MHLLLSLTSVAFGARGAMYLDQDDMMGSGYEDEPSWMERMKALASEKLQTQPPRYASIASRGGFATGSYSKYASSPKRVQERPMPMMSNGFVKSVVDDIKMARGAAPSGDRLARFASLMRNKISHYGGPTPKGGEPSPKGGKGEPQPPPPPPGSSNGFDPNEGVEDISDALRQKYNVQEGNYMFFFLSDCVKYNMETCFLLNGGAPYGMALLPPSPVENVPYMGEITATGVVGDGCVYPGYEGQMVDRICENGMPMKWRVGFDEAIVIMGNSPPESIYWSFTSYVFSQYYNDTARTVPLSDVPFGSPLQGAANTCPDPPARCQHGASLGTPFNNHMLSQQTGGDGFEEPFAIIMSADKKVTEEVKAAIKEETGIDAYVTPYPSDILKMGTDNDFRDIYTNLMRIAYPTSDEEMNEKVYDLCDGWNPDCPIKTLRITPRSTSQAKSSTRPDKSKAFIGTDTTWIDRDLYGMEEGAQEGSPVPILTAAQLNQSLYNLVDKVVATHGGDWTVLPFLPQWFEKGTECLAQGTTCQLDCPDTLYPLSGNAFRAAGCSEASQNAYKMSKSSDPWQQQVAEQLVELCDDGHLATIDGGGQRDVDFYVVVGINHKATLRAKYSSVTLYYYQTLSGVTAHSSEDGYDGSAEEYLGDDEAAPFLYARVYSRDCAAAGFGPDYCYDVPSSGGDNNAPHVPVGGEVMWVTRMYDNPETHAGPIASQTPMDMVLHFT